MRLFIQHYKELHYIFEKYAPCGILELIDLEAFCSEVKETLPKLLITTRDYDEEDYHIIFRLFIAIIRIVHNINCPIRFNQEEFKAEVEMINDLSSFVANNYVQFIRDHDYIMEYAVDLVVCIEYLIFRNPYINKFSMYFALALKEEDKEIKEYAFQKFKEMINNVYHAIGENMTVFFYSPLIKNTIPMLFAHSDEKYLGEDFYMFDNIIFSEECEKCEEVYKNYNRVNYRDYNFDSNFEPDPWELAKKVSIWLADTNPNNILNKEREKFNAKDFVSAFIVKTKKQLKENELDFTASLERLFQAGIALYPYKKMKSIVFPLEFRSDVEGFEVNGWFYEDPEDYFAYDDDLFCEYYDDYDLKIKYVPDILYKYQDKFKDQIKSNKRISTVLEAAFIYGYIFREMMEEYRHDSN